MNRKLHEGRARVTRSTSTMTTQMPLTPRLGRTSLRLRARFEAEAGR
jgi:hypothetical protein